MNIKLLRTLRNTFALLLPFAFILVFVLPLNSFAQTQSKQEVLTLTIKLKDEFNPDFKLCMAIEANVPLEVSWTKGELKSSISALLREAEGEDYRVKFTLKEGTAEKTIYSGMIEPKLKLEKPYETTFVASSLFKNYYSQSLLLSKEACK